MSMNELQKQTNTNIQAKANLIWEIATHLVGLFKPHEYGKVILPMTVLKRFDDALKETKDAVVEMAKKLDEQHVEGAARDGILRTVAKRDFYNTSSFDFAKLIVEPDKIEDYFEEYLQGFSDNVKDIIENFDFDNTVKLMVKGGVLFVTLQEFNSAKADMSPDKITSADMGYIFEELIRKFSESYDEQAGAHFTSRDIIYLMTELLVAPEKTDIMKNGCTKTAYDMAMGTSQMLGCLTERLKEINSEADLTCFGQEFNPETYAIAKADMLIKGGNASGMKYGDTLSNDAFDGYEFDYIISNPPFGIDWKREKEAVEKEAKRGYEGRFGPGVPAISDGQMLFMLNGVKKLKEGYKQSLITEVVTKGIDPTVPMKDSGVEWIGEIPEHWNIERLKFNVSINAEKQSSLDLPYIALEHIEGFSGKRIKTDNVYEVDGAIVAHSGEILFGKLRPYLAKVYKVEEETYVSSEFAVFSAETIDNQYLKWYMLSYGFLDTVNASTYGTKMPRANIDFIKNMYIPVFDVQEQEKIALYLNEKSSKIDQLIAIKQSKIEKLEQYKRSLIYEYVTGKKEVS